MSEEIEIDAEEWALISPSLADVGQGDEDDLAYEAWLEEQELEIEEVAQ